MGDVMMMMMVMLTLVNSECYMTAAPPLCCSILLPLLADTFTQQLLSAP
jgi:hypothetical protein